MITAEILDRLAPHARADYVTALIEGGDTLQHYGITSPERVAALLATALHECGDLTIVRESGNYTAERLVEVWPNHFTKSSAKAYAHNPEKLFNYIYGPNSPIGKDLGNTQPGDGYAFRGGSFLQTTGRYNYTKIGKAIGVDLANHPELIADPKIGLRAACHELAQFAKYCDMGPRGWKAVCNGINRGPAKALSSLDPIGWSSRQIAYKRVCDALGASVAVEDDLLTVGDQGALVKALQERLLALGYAPGKVDGIYGSRMRAAVLAFQAEHDLTTDGKIGPKTRAALNSDSAKPMPVGERSAETAADLKAAGSQIVTDAQAIKNGAKAVGGVAAALGGAQQADLVPAFDPISTSKDVVTEIGSWKVIVNAMGETFTWVTSHWWIFAIVAAFAFYRWGSKIELKRVLDHRLGLHTGR
jgi:putative chitinase